MASQQLDVLRVPELIHCVAKIFHLLFDTATSTHVRYNNTYTHTKDIKKKLRTIIMLCVHALTC